MWPPGSAAFPGDPSPRLRGPLFPAAQAAHSPKSDLRGGPTPEGPGGGWAARASVYIPGTHRPACTSVCSHLCMCDVNTRSTHLHAGPAHRCTHVRTHTLVLPQAAGLPWLCPWAIQPCCIQVSSAQPHGRGESLSPRLSQSRGASWWASTPYAPYPGLPAPKAARDPSEALEG